MIDINSIVYEKKKETDFENQKSCLVNNITGKNNKKNRKFI